MARAHVASLVGPVDLEPHDALQLAIALTAAEVNYFSERIAELGADDIAGQATVSTTRRAAVAEPESGDEPGDVVEVRQLPPSLHVFVKARAHAIERLAKFSKMALDAEHRRAPRTSARGAARHARRDHQRGRARLAQGGNE